MSCSTVEVTGLLGQNVTLPCGYDTRAHGVLSFCWGRGTLPAMKCGDTVLSSQDGAVLFRESPRYQLLGRVTDGDASLTILDAQWSDAGTYGCRIEIPGWFNDEKVHTHLVMEEEMLTTFVTENEELGDSTLDKTEGFSAVLEVGNIGRLAVIFFLSIIIILIFVFRKRKRRTLEHVNSSTAENIYEVV